MPLDKQLLKRLEDIQGAPNVTKQQRARNLSEFVGNIGRDASAFLEGLTHLPELAVELVKHPVDTTGTIINAFVDSYTRLFRDPVGTILKNPLFAAMDLLPIAGLASKGLRIGAGVAIRASVQDIPVMRALVKQWKGHLGTKAERLEARIFESFTGESLVPKFKAWREAKRNMERLPDKALNLDMIYWLNKTHNPAVGDIAGVQGILAVEKRLKAKPEYFRRAEEIRELFNYQWRKLNESGLFTEARYRRDYITMLFEPMSKTMLDAAEKRLGVVAETTNKLIGTKNMLDNPHALTATWHTYVEAAQKMGLKMRFENAEQILAFYQSNTFIAGANVRAYRRMMLLGNEAGIPLVTYRSYLPGYVKAPEFTVTGGFVRAMKGAKRRGDFAKRSGVTKEALRDMDKTLKAVRNGQAYMHESLYKGAWEGMKPGGIEGSWARRLMVANAVTKKTALAVSLFHTWALTESNMALMGPLKGMFNFGKENGVVAKYGTSKLTYKRGLKRFLDDDVFAEDMVRWGIADIPEMDAVRGIVEKGLLNFEGSAKAAGAIGAPAAGLARGMRWGFNKFDKMMWDHYYTGMKSYAWSELLPEMMNHPALKHLDEAQIKGQLADLINNAFGGQQMGKLGVSRKSREVMGLFLLAPDWTISNIRIAADGIIGLKRLGHRNLVKTVGKGGKIPEHLLDGVQDVLGRRYWGNMALSQFMVGNTANFLFSGVAKTREAGEELTWENVQKNGVFMWDNDHGREFDIQHPGGKDEKGRRRYIKIAKQAWEPYQWISNPFRTFGGKIAPATQALIEQVTGVSTTGFPQDFKDKGFVESLPMRAQSLASKFLPISAAGKSFLFALPTKTAISGFELIKQYQLAIIKADKDELMELDNLANSNGFKAKVMRALAKRNIKRELKKRRGL